MADFDPADGTAHETINIIPLPGRVLLLAAFAVVLGINYSEVYAQVPLIQEFKPWLSLGSVTLLAVAGTWRRPVKFSHPRGAEFRRRRDVWTTVGRLGTALIVLGCIFSLLETWLEHSILPPYLFIASAASYVAGVVISLLANALYVRDCKIVVER